MKKPVESFATDLNPIVKYLGNTKPPQWIRPAFEYWDGERWLTDTEAREAADKAENENLN